MSKVSATDYSSWTHEELVSKIRKLECHVQQLQNVIAKQRCEDGSELFHKKPKMENPKKKPREFDFSKASFRRVAFKVLYLGWDYQGLAAQEDTTETVEAHFFKALTLTKLIEHRSKSEYSRCGRTDKGVSAFCQVLSLNVRSKEIDGQETMDYCKILNKTLPINIRVIAWSPVRPEFSARFSCIRRMYKYFFPRGDLNLDKIVESAQWLIGEHDFRNFCKLDKEKCRTTVRRILNVDVSCDHISKFGMGCISITGESFVWHQIRCIVSVLLSVGEGLEEPDIVRKLLDIEEHPLKPQYQMAADYPLVLYSVDYPNTELLDWKCTKGNLEAVVNDLHASWIQHSTKSTMIQKMIEDIMGMEKGIDTFFLSVYKKLLPGTKSKSYIKLIDRPTCK